MANENQKFVNKYKYAQMVLALKGLDRHIVDDKQRMTNYRVCADALAALQQELMKDSKGITTSRQLLDEFVNHFYDNKNVTSYYEAYNADSKSFRLDDFNKFIEMNAAVFSDVNGFISGSVDIGSVKQLYANIDECVKDAKVQNFGSDKPTYKNIEINEELYKGLDEKFGIREGYEIFLNDDFQIYNSEDVNRELGDRNAQIMDALNYEIERVDNSSNIVFRGGNAEQPSDRVRGVKSTDELMQGFKDDMGNPYISQGDFRDEAYEKYRTAAMTNFCDKLLLKYYTNIEAYREKARERFESGVLEREEFARTHLDEKAAEREHEKIEDPNSFKYKIRYNFMYDMLEESYDNALDNETFHDDINNENISIEEAWTRVVDLFSDNEGEDEVERKLFLKDYIKSSKLFNAARNVIRPFLNGKKSIDELLSSDVYIALKENIENEIAENAKIAQDNYKNLTAYEESTNFRNEKCQNAYEHISDSFNADYDKLFKLTDGGQTVEFRAFKDAMIDCRNAFHKYQKGFTEEAPDLAAAISELRTKAVEYMAKKGSPNRLFQKGRDRYALAREVAEFCNYAGSVYNSIVRVEKGLNPRNIEQVLNKEDVAGVYSKAEGKLSKKQLEEENALREKEAETVENANKEKVEKEKEKEIIRNEGINISGAQEEVVPVTNAKGKVAPVPDTPEFKSASAVIFGEMIDKYLPQTIRDTASGDKLFDYIRIDGKSLNELYPNADAETKKKAFVDALAMYGNMKVTDLGADEPVVKKLTREDLEDNMQLKNYTMQYKEAIEKSESEKVEEQKTVEEKPEEKIEEQNLEEKIETELNQEAKQQSEEKIENAEPEKTVEEKKPEEKIEEQKEKFSLDALSEEVRKEDEYEKNQLKIAEIEKLQVPIADYVVSKNNTLFNQRNKGILNTNSVEVLKKELDENKNLNQKDKNYLKARIQAETVINMFEANRKNMNIKTVEPSVEAGRISMKNINLERYQTNGNSCWASSMSLLIQSRGINISQDYIQAHRPIESLKEAEALDDDKTLQLNADTTVNMFARSELLIKVLPNTAVRRRQIGRANDDNYKLLFKDTVREAMLRDKSPVAITMDHPTEGKHVITVTGIDNDKIYYKDSLNPTGLGTNPNEDKEMFISQLFNGSEQTIDLVWLKDIQYDKTIKSEAPVDAEFGGLTYDAAGNIHQNVKTSDKFDEEKEVIGNKGLGISKLVLGENVSYADDIYCPRKLLDLDKKKEMDRTDKVKTDITKENYHEK